MVDLDPICAPYSGVLFSLSRRCLWQRALWIGSLKAARVGAAVTALLAVGLVLRAVTTMRSDMFETGTIWYLVVALAVQLIIVFALGAASVILLRRQRDATLIAMLRQNSRHRCPAAMLHLCGIVTPRRRALGALVHRSVLLSGLAFCLEGTAFYVYFRHCNAALEKSFTVVYWDRGAAVVPR